MGLRECRPNSPQGLQGQATGPIWSLEGDLTASVPDKGRLISKSHRPNSWILGSCGREIFNRVGRMTHRMQTKKKISYCQSSQA
jgi:hypothetical protein